MGATFLLTDIDLKFKYDSDKDNLIKDFYIPVLSNSSEYYRMSGFFSSSSLAISAQGIAEFIRSGGHMKLLCSSKLPKDDMEILEKFHNNPEKFLEESFFNDLNTLEDEFIKNHVEALGWMIANDLLEIKIAIPNDERGIFHSKIGILKDYYGNLISFSGSDNETASGWLHNIEEFKVFRSWDESERKFVDTDLEDFNKYWNGETIKTDIIDLPEAIKRELIQLAPPSKEDLAILNDDVIPGIKLRKYQNEAIDKWFNNDCRGIFEMATGTGKTLTSLACFKKLLDNKNKILTVIACPQLHLIDQWINDLEKFYDGDILIVSSKNPGWESKLKELMKYLNMGIIDNAVVLSTHKSLSSDNFLKFIKKYNIDYFLLVDEVHGIGSEKQKLALIDEYNYRLGLSATPERWFDEEGTAFLNEYFGGVVFEFDIERALKYYEYGVKIAQALTSNDKDALEKATKYSNLRQKIVNNAESKYEALKNILHDYKIENHKDMDKLIVFCSDRQIDEVQRILTKNHITPQHRFTNVQSAYKKKGDKESEREKILRNFSDGDYKALVAIKCLDEGVDVPAAENAIIMSSTSNPREHVQRRGRILRHYPGKEKAYIYDLLVFPKEETNAGKNILRKEFKRYREFARNADNADECIKTLKKYYKMVV